MPSHITVVPASTSAGAETIRKLLASDQKPLVRGVYRTMSKVPADFADNPNFEAVQGDVGSGNLDFRDSNAVFYIPPPTHDGTDQGEFAVKASENVKKALQSHSTVKRLLLFSAMGAQYDHGIGTLRLNHIAEARLKDAVPEVVIIRPGFFHEIWAPAFDTIKSGKPTIYSQFSPPEYKIPMLSVIDIATECAKRLLSESSSPSPYAFKMFGPRHYSSIDLKSAFEQVTGKEFELVCVQVDKLVEFFAQQLPPVYAEDYKEMTTSLLPGGIMAGDFECDEGTVVGKIELVDALRAVYEQR